MHVNRKEVGICFYIKSLIIFEIIPKPWISVLKKRYPLFMQYKAFIGKRNSIQVDFFKLRRLGTT